MVTVANNGHILHTLTSYTDTIAFTEGGHTLTIPIEDGTFDSDAIAPGSSYTLATAALNKGTYTFFCEFHPWMLGTLTVT